ncbi:MAG: hypothetical protein QOE66_2308, partial [Chloroflexota bacterium]|nr:hypothetical protein [Chloroflexota bacterium]
MIIVSISVALTAAVIFYPALALGRARRRAVLVPLWAAILLTPLLVPPDRPFLRLLASVLAVALSAKLYDLHVGAERGDRPDLRTFLLFLPNLASVVLRKLDAEPRPGRGEGLVRLARAGLGAMIGTALLIAAFHVDWFRIPFAVEHCTKVVAFFLALVPATGAAVEVWRLLGGKGRDPMDHPFAARTPADFWRRYNRPAQQFFRDDLFRPLGGLHRPIRATLATFAISALIHEYVFDIAVGRIQGHQTVFFLVQGLAVGATWGVKPQGWRAVPWTVGTWAFTLASSVLFFASVNEVVPFYTGRGAPEKPTTGDPTMSEAESDQDSI